MFYPIFKVFSFWHWLVCNNKCDNINNSFVNKRNEIDKLKKKAKLAEKTQKLIYRMKRILIYLFAKNLNAVR